MIPVKKQTLSYNESWQSNRTLVQCLDYLFLTALEADVRFLVGEIGEKVKAHSFILKARSPVLCKILSASHNQLWEITLFKSNKPTMVLFLRYLYTDMVDLTIPDALSLIGLARQFQVKQLITLCEAYLQTNTTTAGIKTVVFVDDTQSKSMCFATSRPRATTKETSGRFIKSSLLPADVQSPHKPESVNDFAAILLQLRRKIDNRQKSAENTSLGPPEMGNQLKRRQPVDTASKSAEDLVTPDDSIVIKRRRCGKDKASKSVDVSSPTPVHQHHTRSKKPHTDSGLKSSDEVGLVLPEKESLSQYSKDRIVAYQTNLENYFVDNILQKTPVEHPLDNKVSSTTPPADREAGATPQRQSYNFTRKTKVGQSIGKPISGTSKEQHPGDKVSWKKSPDMYLGKKISRNISLGQFMAPFISGETALSKQKSGKPPQGQTKLQEQTLGNTPGQRWRDKIFDLTSPQPNRGIDVSDTTFCRNDISDTTSLGNDVSDSTSRGNNVTDATSRGNDISNATSKGKDVTGATSRGNDISNATSQGKDVTDATSRGKEVTGVTSHGNDVTNAKSCGKDVTGATSRGNDISNTKSKGKDVTDATSRGNDISNAKTPGKDVTCAKSRGKEVTDATSRGNDVTNAKSCGKDVTGKKSRGKDVTDTMSRGKDVTGTMSHWNDATDTTSRGNNVTDKISGGNEVSDTTSHGQPNSTNIMAGTAKAVCDDPVTDATRCDVSSDAQDNGSGDCIGNSSDRNITKNIKSATVDRLNVTPIISLLHNYKNTTGIKPASSEEPQPKTFNIEELNLTGGRPGMSEKVRNCVVEQINDLDSQINDLKADILNNHGYQKHHDNNSSSNCPDDCLIVTVESGTGPSDVSNTDVVYEGEVEPTAQSDTGEDKGATPLDLRTAPCQGGSKNKVKTSIESSNMPNLLLLDLVADGKSYTQQSEIPQTFVENKSKKRSKKKKKKNAVSKAKILGKTLVMKEKGKEIENVEEKSKTETKSGNDGVLDKCEVCGQCFSSAISLLIHMREHAGELHHQCELCGKGFTLMASLQHHLKRHEEDDFHSCSICGKWYASRHTLRQHLHVHHSGNDYHVFRCRVCGLACDTKRKYSFHMRQHKKAKLQYECQTCSEAFSFKEDLTTHEKMHRPYRCEVCNMTFWSRIGRDGHLKNHKDGECEKSDYNSGTDVLDSPVSLSEHSNTHKGSPQVDSPESNFENSNLQKGSPKLDSPESKFGHSSTQKGSPKLDSPESKLGHSSTQKGSPKLDSPESKLGHSSTQKGSPKLDSPESKLGHSSTQKGSPKLDSPESKFGHSSTQKGSPKLDSPESKLGHSSTQKSITQVDSPDSLSSEQSKIHKSNAQLDSPESKLGHSNTQKGRQQLDSQESNLDLTETQKGDIVTCDICKKSFDCIESWKTHRKTHGTSEKYECILCKRVFRKKYYLDRHYRYHSGDRYFPCSKCEEEFDKKRELLQHQFSVHKKKTAFSYSCGTCSLVFPSHRSFRTHMASHSITKSNAPQEKTQTRGHKILYHTTMQDKTPKPQDTK